MAETTEGAVVKQINEIRQCSGRFLRLAVGLLVVVKVNRAIDHRIHLGLHRGVIPALTPRLKLQECRIALLLKTTPHAMKTRVADLQFYGLIDRLDTSLAGQCPILCYSPHMSIICEVLKILILILSHVESSQIR